MLASVLGLCLAGGLAGAQQWSPSSGSPYGGWRASSPAASPAPAAASDLGSLPPPPPAPPKASGSVPPPPPVPTPARKDDAPSGPVLPARVETPAIPPQALPRPERPPVVPAIQAPVLQRDIPPALVIQRVAMQPPARADDRTDEGLSAVIQLEPPGPERIFRLESEAALDMRIIQEGRDKRPPERVAFPDEPFVSRETYAGRHWPPSFELAEPNYLCYKRLLFEQINAERYGYDLGVLHPFLSAGIFFFDVAALPYHLGTAPCRCYDCNAGLCLPGDPVPFMLYPPELSLTGAIAEAGTIVALIAIFP